MSSFNRVILLGTVGKAPEQRFMPSGDTWCRFNIAQNKYKKSKNGDGEVATEWFSVCAFKEIADRCIDHLEKGSQVIVEGRLKNNSYEKNGQKFSSVEIIAEKVHPFFKKKWSKGSGYSTSSSQQGSHPSKQSGHGDENFAEHYQATHDEIPF